MTCVLHRVWLDLPVSMGQPGLPLGSEAPFLTSVAKFFLVLFLLSPPLYGACLLLLLAAPEAWLSRDLPNAQCWVAHGACPPHA